MKSKQKHNRKNIVTNDSSTQTEELIKNPVSNKVKTDALIKNIIINWIFYIVLLCCLYALSKCEYYKTSIHMLIISFITVAIIGYIIHRVSHNIYFEEYYENMNTIFKDVPLLDRIIKLMLRGLDFHRKTHHDSAINRKWYNLVYEFINNIVTQGLLPAILIKASRYLDLRVFILWGLLYATLHIINYNFITSTVHIEHHLDDSTNYGIDICDIIFGSKYDWNDVENYNHYAINVIIITIAILYATKYSANFDFFKFFNF